MQINLIYPKIPENSDKFHGKCIAFEKYDGTNLHWVWDCQEGWTKFGTRRTQFTLDARGISGFQFNHHECRNAADIFNAELRDKLTMMFSKHPVFSVTNAVLFTEFYGAKSFAGGHEIDDEHELVIIDVMMNNRLMEPDKFIKTFQGIGCAQVIYTGKYNGQFAEDVRNGKYNVNEGVVVKGVVDGEVFMTKVKTKEYLKRLEKR